MAYRPARSGSEGNTRLLKSYGGSASPPRQSYPQGYATGGAVKSGNPALAEGMAATSVKAPKASAKAGGKKAAGKGKGTNVNVIVVPGGKPGAAPEAPPPMPMAGLPVPVGPGPAGPPMPPPGPDGMPMRKSGGRVKKADGGSTISEDSKTEAKRLRSAASEDVMSGVGTALHTLPVMIGGAALTALSKGRLGRAIGSSATMGSALAGAGASASRVHAGIRKGDEARRIERGLVRDGEEDRKSGGRVNRSVGGPAKPPKGFDAGAGGGKGRIEKAKRYGK